jgi:RNA polymerase sigma-70 factor (ECF subfamily)
MQLRWSRPGRRDRCRASRRIVQLRAGLDPQPCRGRGPGTGNLRSRYPGDGKAAADSNNKGWRFTILRNIWLNQLRKWRNGPQLIEMEFGEGVANSMIEPSKDSPDLYVSKLEAEQVRAAIQELPVDFREIILLREYEDLSYQEIASVLDCPVGTVMSRLGRARAKLRPLLAATLKGSDRPERGAKHEGLR